MGKSSKKNLASPNELTLWQRLRWLALIIVLLWVIEFIDQITPGLRLDAFGVLPRRMDGLLGIFFTPFLHGDFYHLAANTVPLAFFAALLLLHGRAYFIRITFALMVTGGLITWCFGRQAYHIGASGLIFGYFGFLITRAIFERSFAAILVALIVGLTYGSLVFSIFSNKTEISWEGHLGGFLAGIWLAYRYAKKQKK